MPVFYIALLAGIAVAVAYLYLVKDGFERVRRDYDDEAAGVPRTAEVDYELQGRGFSWVAGGGVVASTTLLVLASYTGAVWYLLPFLAIGTAVAVVSAFLVDRREDAVSAAAATAEGVAR